MHEVGKLRILDDLLVISNMFEFCTRWDDEFISYYTVYINRLYIYVCVVYIYIYLFICV